MGNFQKYLGLVSLVRNPDQIPFHHQRACLNCFVDDPNVHSLKIGH